MGVAQLLHRLPRRVRRWSLVPGAVALLVVPGLVWQSSYAGFSDSTAPLAATVGTGQLLLGNSVSVVGTAVSLGELLPGQTSAYCIAVTSTGTVPAEVRLYGRGMSATKALDSAVQLSWVAGTGGGTDGDCTGFVPSGPTSDTTFSSFPTSWATGVLPWTLTGGAGGEDRSYRLTCTADPDAPASTKGGTATATFVWEARTR